MNYKFKPTENKVTSTTLFGVGFLFIMENKNYFTHDYRSRLDTKLLEVRMKHGMEGFGVYWGSRKVVEKYFDANGVIFLEDDPELQSLSKEKYESMMPYIQKNYELALQLPIAEDYIYENYIK